MTTNTDPYQYSPAQKERIAHVRELEGRDGRPKKVIISAEPGLKFLQWYLGQVRGFSYQFKLLPDGSELKSDIEILHNGEHVADVLIRGRYTDDVLEILKTKQGQQLKPAYPSV